MNSALHAGHENPHIYHFPEPFTVEGSAVGSYLLKMDSTGMTFSSMRFMDQVENWVFPSLGVDEKSRADVKARLARLAEIISEYRSSIPPGNDTFLKTMSWLNTSVVLYVVAYLSELRSDFVLQLMDYCRSNEELNVDAALMLKRTRALIKARVFHRAFGPENVGLAERIIFTEVTS